MSQSERVTLKDGRQMEVVRLTYPIGPADRMGIIELLQQEWARTDVDWLQSMRGAYAQTLRTQVALARVDGHAVGTASMAFACDRPRVGVVEDVMTREDFRGLGIAATLTEGLVQRAWEAGCRVVYLGNSPRQVSVYEKIGFRRLYGAVMRRAAPGETEPEKDFFAPGQQTSVRPANWGDLPGVACLMAQPMESLCLDFLRGLVSPRYAPPLRCVSNFTSLWYGMETLGGAMLALEGEDPHRVLGLGSITPGPAPLRGHSAVIDALAHDNYPQGVKHLLDRLVETARQKGIALLQAYAAATDSSKVEHFRAVGLTPVAMLPEAIRLKDRPVDAILLQGRCKAVESEE